MHTVHEKALTGFTAGAEAYASGRPDYPVALDGWLTAEIGLAAGKTVVDLGAGTGKFLPRLTATGARVVAVEPVAAMRQQLLKAHPEVIALEGAADRMPLADGSVDAVVCAQSFHWFATAEALAEIHRVLKPGGRLGLVWNVRDERVPWVAALTALLTPYESDAKRYHKLEWRGVFPSTAFGPLREAHFRHHHVGSPERVIVDRVRSTSFIAALPPGERARIDEQVRALIAATPELANHAEISFPYLTAAFSTIRLD